MTSATFVAGSIEVTLARSVMLWLPPESTEPTVHTPVPESYEPPAFGVAPTKTREAGSVSVTLTPVAWAGPALPTVIVNSTTWFALGVASSTPLVSDRSTRSITSTSVAVLLSGVGSVYGPPTSSTRAVLEISVRSGVIGSTTVTAKSTLPWAPPATLPIVRVQV